jgi:hypothetical protein
MKSFKTAHFFRLQMKPLEEKKPAFLFIFISLLDHFVTIVIQKETKVLGLMKMMIDRVYLTLRRSLRNFKVFKVL